MSNTRASSATITDQPARDREQSPFTYSAIAWPTTALTNLTSIASQSVTATYALWVTFFESQKRFAARLLGAMGVSPTAQSRNPQPRRSLVASSADAGNNERDERVDGVPQALADSARRRAASPVTVESEFPIKRYDTLTVQEIAGRIGRLHDRAAVEAVLAYEAKHKARKGVAAAAAARLARLQDS